MLFVLDGYVPRHDHHVALTVQCATSIFSLQDNVVSRSLPRASFNRYCNLSKVAMNTQLWQLSRQVRVAQESCSTPIFSAYVGFHNGIRLWSLAIMLSAVAYLWW